MNCDFRIDGLLPEIDVSATAGTAGFVLVNIYMLDAEVKKYRYIGEFNLNTAKGCGGYPPDFKWNGEMAMKQVWRFCQNRLRASFGPDLYRDEHPLAYSGKLLLAIIYSGLFIFDNRRHARYE
ncbi:MAG TPA: hypothetical protein DET40_12565 [Lentisphaeria bacterium]|nr:MAG: hypothetical protein A2X45_22375 [Lentisphaerae bacterium GWF2_50_93]HCE44372.1 hypothetical protein [Lentisphaeria bacterium]